MQAEMVSECGVRCVWRKVAVALGVIVCLCSSHSTLRLPVLTNRPNPSFCPSPKWVLSGVWVKWGAYEVCEPLAEVCIYVVNVIPTSDPRQVPYYWSDAQRSFISINTGVEELLLHRPTDHFQESPEETHKAGWTQGIPRSSENKCEMYKEQGRTWKEKAVKGTPKIN